MKICVWKRVFAFFLAVMITAGVFCPSVAVPAETYFDGQVDTLINIGSWQMAELELYIQEQHPEDWAQHWWHTGYDSSNVADITDTVIGEIDTYAASHGDKAQSLAIMFWFGSSENFTKPGFKAEHWWDDYPNPITWPKDDPEEFADSDSYLGEGIEEIFDIVDYYHREPKFEEVVLMSAADVEARRQELQASADAEAARLNAEEPDVIHVPVEVTPQMAIEGTAAYNHDPWSTVFGDDTTDHSDDLSQLQTLYGDRAGDNHFDGDGNYVGSKFAGWESVLDHASALTRYREALQDIVKHASGKGAKIYWMSLCPPRDYAMLEEPNVQTAMLELSASSHAYMGLDGNPGYEGKLNTLEKSHTNASVVQHWNQACQGKSVAGKYVDMYTEMALDNPYFTGANQSSYDKMSNQHIWHMMWNTVQILNPKKEGDEAIDTALYSIASSLAAYANNVLGPNASEGHAHAIPTPAGPGSGGIYLGYGDSDYKWRENLVSIGAKNSSRVSYQSLSEISGDPGHYVYGYARYGRLLADLGLDSNGADTYAVPDTAIPGGIMLVSYGLSAFSGKAFNMCVTFLQYLNPFQFFSRSTHVVPWVRNHLAGNYSSWYTGDGRTTGVFGDSTSLSSDMTGRTVQHVDHTSNLTSNSAYKTLVRKVSEFYDLLTDMGWAFSIPLFFVVLLVSVIFSKGFRKDVDDGGRAFTHVRNFLLRLFIIAGAVPVLGIMYTHTLDFLDEITSDNKIAASQIVAGTFVEFGEWASQYRLSPMGTLVSDPTASGSGEASPASLKAVRATAQEINKNVGVIEDVFPAFGDVSVLDWNKMALTTEDSAASDTSVTYRLISLLFNFCKDNFYLPGDWESDATGASQGLVNYGMRKSADSEDFDEETNQGEGTYYHLADNTNEYDDWDGRSDEENNEITSGAKYAGFNIFANGGMTWTASGDVFRSTITYNAQTPAGKLTGLNTTGGLSTLSMYNYLCSRFDPTGVTIYSVKNSANQVQALYHKQINIVGGNLLVSILFYMNCLALLLVSVIVSLMYGFHMVYDALKRGIRALSQIPGAALGFLHSGVALISAVLGMAVSVVGTVFLYVMVSNVAYFIVTVMEDILRGNDIIGDGSVGVIGISSGLVSRCSGSYEVFLFWVGFSALILFSASFVLLRYRKFYLGACLRMQERFMMLFIPEKVKERMKNRNEETVVSPVCVFSVAADLFRRVFSEKAGCYDAVL